MNETAFSHHEPCPQCGSRDNLGVWTDGHKYCFGCSYTVGATYTRHQHNISNTKSQISESNPSLPSDAGIYIPYGPLSWLYSYDLTYNEVLSNRILWSEDKKYLCFPYFSQSNVLEAWQARYFGDNKDHPKWITYGKIKDHIKIFNLNQAKEHGIILVEDIVSAIKVGRWYPSSPIFGSHLDWSQIGRYGRYTDKLTLWLDSDKVKEAHKFARRASLMGLNVRVIHTKDDPKSYSDIDIKKYLTSDL